MLKLRGVHATKWMSPQPKWKDGPSREEQAAEAVSSPNYCCCSRPLQALMQLQQGQQSLPSACCCLHLLKALHSCRLNWQQQLQRLVRCSLQLAASILL
jgi:hypothetical protein